MEPTTILYAEGEIPFVVDGQTYQTWYRAWGDLKQTACTPLVVLHGGPGLVHDYLVPLSDLATTHSIPVIVYDQLGNGRSSHIRDKPESFPWSIDLYIAELVNVLKFLNIEDNFDILGHSWGGMLGAEFELRRQPAGMKHLVLTNSLPKMELWGKSNALLLEKFPDGVKEGLSAGLSDLERYGPALAEFHSVHGCTIKPPPAEFVHTMAQVFGEDGDSTVGKYMMPLLGPWSIVDELHRVRVPTLVINGRHDIAQDFVVAPFFKHIQKVKWITFENSSHTPMWEERERYMQVVGDFLLI